MSNVIKAYSVRYDDEGRKTIDTHFRIDKEVVDKQKKAIKTMEPQRDEFVEGLQAIFVEQLPSDEEIAENTSKIIESAQNEANEIIEQAKKEAEQVKKEAFTAAQKKGYEEGLLKAKKEAQQLKAEYEEKAERLQKEYDEAISSLEPQMAELIAALVEKITGVIVEDQEDVILYLINQSIRTNDKSDAYTIKVSKEDYEFVLSKKEDILNEIGKSVPINIFPDVNLIKNQCLIETDMKVINCSLDVQLHNLITDIKLLSSI